MMVDQAGNLEDLASAVLEGRPVDWDTVESRADRAVRDLVRELRVVSAIVALHATDAPRDEPSTIAGSTWGHLRLREPIGEGAFGQVYRAWDTRLDREVALKLLRIGESRDDARDSVADASRVIDEGRMLARVRHPHVVTVYGAERFGGRAGVWMEFIRGRTLDAIVRREGPFGAREATMIGIDLCRALAAVHQAGLLHRDLTARNVMREEGGRIVLMDFGASRDDVAQAARSGVQRELAGTPLYVAPELFEGRTADHRTEIYGLGVLLYFLVTGTYPVKGRSLADIREAHQRGERTPLRDVRADLPPPFVQVIERALALEPDARYQTTGALEAALAAATAGAAPHVSPRGQRAARGLALLALAALLGAGAFWYGNTPAENTVAPRTAFRARDWVLVTAFDNRTGNAQFDDTLEHALAHELGNSAYVNVVPRARIEDALRLMRRSASTRIDADVGREVALRDGGTRLVLAGGIGLLGGVYVMTARVIDPRDGTVIASRREEAGGHAEVRAAVRRLSNAVRTTLGEPRLRVERDAAQLEKVTTPSLHALRLYSEGFNAASRSRWPAAEALLRSALAEDPAFASAQVWLAWTLWSQARPPDTYLSAARRAFELAGTTTPRERHFILGSFFRMNDQIDRAVGEFEALVRLYPDDYWGLTKLSEMYAYVGRGEHAAALLERAAAARPNDLLMQAEAARELVIYRGLDSARPLFLRARQLLAVTPPDTEFFWHAKSYVLLFPVAELWTERRARDAVAALDASASRPEIAADGDLGTALLSSLYMALGQIRRAEEVASRIHRADWRALKLATPALARHDTAGAIRQLRGYESYDPVAASMAIRAGDLRAAEQIVRRLKTMDRRNRRWAAAEVEAARGRETGPIEEALDSGVRGGRRYHFLQTVVDARVRAGDVKGAIAALEKWTPASQTTYHAGIGNHMGFAWLDARKRLADLYRKVGRTEEARAIEKDLLLVLHAADPDLPLLRELKGAP